MGTHLNAYKEDLTEALGKIHELVSEAEQMAAAFIKEVETKLNPVVPPAETPEEPVAPAASRASDGKFASKS